jgi:hypothetical protein
VSDDLVPVDVLRMQFHGAGEIDQVLRAPADRVAVRYVDGDGKDLESPIEDQRLAGEERALARSLPKRFDRRKTAKICGETHQMVMELEARPGHRVKQRRQMVVPRVSFGGMGSGVAPKAAPFEDLASSLDLFRPQEEVNIAHGAEVGRVKALSHEGYSLEEDGPDACPRQRGEDLFRDFTDLGPTERVKSSLSF